MAELIFHGPFHFDDIDKTGKIIINDKNVPNPNKAGIYIWGFMYYYGRHGLIAPVYHRNSLPVFNPDVMKFIPYYVGKSKNNIYAERIIHHHDVRNNKKSKSVQADKYTRLSHGYMMEFFKDVEQDNFPIFTSGQSKQLIQIIQNKCSKIIYHNDGKVLMEIYPDIHPKPLVPQKENPITNFQINGCDIPDTLEDLVDYMNNFWFCYAEFKEDDLLEICETQVFYSLKGKTISKTHLCPITDHSVVIIDNTNTRIFKDKGPTDKFPGYNQ